MATENRPSDEQELPPAKTISPSLDEELWILTWLKKLDQRLDEQGRILTDLRKRMARIEENIKTLPEIKTDIKSMTRNYWIAFGIFLALVFLFKIFLPDFAVTITPKP